MAQIDISNFINVNISTIPQSLNSKNVNVIAIFTKETPLFPIDNFVIYKSPTSCGADFGVNSKTFEMVNIIFSQNLNVLAGGGYVVVFPMLKTANVPATAGTLTCKKMVYSNFARVLNGTFKIAVNGGEEVKINCDLSTSRNLNDVAVILQEALAKANISVSVITNNNDLIFVNSTTGINSKIAITVDDTGTDLTKLEYFNIAQAITVDGTDAYTGEERLQDALLRTYDLTFYEAILTSYQLTNEEILPSAKIVQTRPQLLFVTSNVRTSIGGVFTTIQQSGFTHTRCLFNGKKQELLFAAGYASKLLSVNFDGSGTANNLNAKAIVGILPDTNIDDTVLLQCQNAGVDVYASLENIGVIVCSGKNEWSDTVLFLNWLQTSLQLAGFNTLRNTPTKIPQTEQGIQILENSYRTVVERAVALGYVAAGDWNLPFTFGNQELFYNNIKQVGYYIYFEPLANQSAKSRNNREAPLCQIAIKLAGAVNSSNIIVFVNN